MLKKNIFSQPVDEKIEIGMRNMKNRVMQTYTEYKNVHCDEKGNIKNDNLTKAIRAGLKQCKEKSKASEAVYNTTDKSNQFTMKPSSDIFKTNIF